MSGYMHEVDPHLSAQQHSSAQLHYVSQTHTHTTTTSPVTNVTQYNLNLYNVIQITIYDHNLYIQLLKLLIPV